MHRCTRWFVTRVCGCAACPLKKKGENRDLRRGDREMGSLLIHGVCVACAQGNSLAGVDGGPGSLFSMVRCVEGLCVCVERERE